MGTHLDHKNSFDESPSSPEARASRLKRLRNLANLSRKEMCEASDIKHDTLIGWEVSRHGGLSKIGAQKVISRVAKAGVQCTLEWLLEGIGPMPIIFPNLIIGNSSEAICVEEKIIHNELLFFKSQYPDAIDYVVEDDGMIPQYFPDDHLAGIKRYGEKISHLIGYDCIVQLTDGIILLRRLQEGSKENLYNLSCINPKTTAISPTIFNIELICAAPVIWIRKKDSKIKS